MSDSLGLNALVLPHLNGLKVHLPDTGPARYPSQNSLICGQKLLSFPVQVWVSQAPGR